MAEQNNVDAENLDGVKAIGHSIGRFFRGEQDWQKDAAQTVGKEAHVAGKLLDHKYHLVRSVAIRTEGKPPFEAGQMHLVDPHGNVVFSAQYNAGGKGRGAPPLNDEHVSAHVEHHVTLIGGKVTVPVALRVANKDTHMSGVLFHQGGGESFGCFHFAPNDMNKFAGLWEKIPPHQKSLVLHTELDRSHEAYTEAVKNLSAQGISISDSANHTLIASISKPHQRGI